MSRDDTYEILQVMLDSNIAFHAANQTAQPQMIACYTD
jgi:hypothetical protein